MRIPPQGPLQAFQPARSPPLRDPPSQGAPRSIEARLMQSVLQAFGHPPIDVVLWTGERINGRGAAVATVHINDRRTLMRLCADPDMQFGEGYSQGGIDVEGDLGELLETLYGAAASPGNSSVTVARRLAQRLHRRRDNSLRGSRENIHYHYDMGNEFYALWLGESMAYTCAYFRTPQATLAEAQFAKMEHVCRKLRLTPGQEVVEAGCGWGSLALHMARHHGVKVRAYNISREQLAYARSQAATQGLQHAVEFVEDDYRNIRGSYDAFVSVGMLEHVGVEHYPALGELIRACLKPQGLGLIHTIGRNRWKPMHRWIERRIFPGANPPSLRQMMDIFEDAQLSVLDVENLRLHYARTLQCWHESYERSGEQVTAMFDERFLRMWRLYLLGSHAAFATGALQLFQVVFSHAQNNDVPWTREHLYAP